MALGEKYNTGVVWQDFQHSQLMDLFFKIKKAKSQKTGQEVIRYSAAFLAMYVNHHFKLEEEYMDIYYYPDAENHKKEHREYIRRIKSFRKKMDGEKEIDVDGLIGMLNSWILNHILQDDKQLGDYILNAEKKALQKKE